jgi:two-component system, chemotaxis family, sensor kinase CheA
MPVSDAAHDASLLAIFREEFDEISARLEYVAVRIAASPEPADVDEAFRALHTLKGNCYAMGYEQMGRLVHAFEDVLRELKDDNRVGRDVGEVLLDVNDRLRRMVNDTALLAPDELLHRIRRLDERAPPPAPGRAEPPATDAAGRAGTIGSRPVAAAAQKQARDSLTIPVGVAELDALFSAVEGFRSRLLNAGETALARRAEELSRILLTVRKLPIERLATRLQRVALETARSLGRPARLVVNGQNQNADAAVVQDLTVVLPHMIRNAIDHGIESADERQRAGKPAEGMVRVSFAEEHGAFVVDIEDDGRGLSPDAIAASAVKRGLVSAEEVAQMSDEDRLRLSFRAGVSTSERVTEVSGRGIGLDVVAAVVQRHRGRVDIASQPGRGTRFELSFPVLFRWEEYLVVLLDHREVGLPVRYVREVVPDGVSDDAAAEPGVVSHRDETLPVLTLPELQPHQARVDGRPLVVLQVGERAAALPVDALGGFAATLVQALPGRNPPPCIAGLGQTAEGGILWGVDLEEVFREFESYRVKTPRNR